MIVFPEKWNEGKKGERRAKGDDDCFPLLAWLILPTEEIVRLYGLRWSIPPLWEDGQHISPSISACLSSSHSIFSFSFLSFLSVRPSFGFYYVFSHNCFSLQIILEVRSTAIEQIVIKSYKFLWNRIQSCSRHVIKAKYDWEFYKLKGEGVCHLDGGAHPEPKGSNWLYML